MSARRLLALAGLLLCTAAVAPSPAAAEFGPIELVSKTPVQQADQAIAPALSADGRYLVFQGTLGASEGVFRIDLASGTIVPVAAAPAGEFGGRYATAPSISADGRYVSFTSIARIDPGDDTQASSSDVYVADMASTPPTYELASALDGCDPTEAAAHPACGLTYGGPGGAEASGRVALSADGRRLVFVTSATSNLTSGPGGSTEGVPTPARQVVLRDLATDTTTLVSVERDAESGAMTQRPVPGGSLLGAATLAALRGASLSADGTTVAWLGTHLPAQVPLSAAEAKAFSELDAGAFPYDEPLWRRVADGPAAPIRRVVAGDGPADPFPDMTNKETGSLNFAEGWLGLGRVDGVPQLSADGRTVALIGNPTEAANLFVVDMAPGLSRAQAVTQLTREIVVNPTNPAGTINQPAFVPLDGNIFDLAISGDGQRIAFTTARQRFPLAPPNLVGSPPTSVGLVELYLIDRRDQTLERVTHGSGGEEEVSADPVDEKGTAPGQLASEGRGASAPSLGAGGLIAFASDGSNLAPNDSNEASDAFLVADTEAAGGPDATRISPGPPGIRRRQPWRLTLSAFSLPDGSVRLLAGVPGAGTLRARVGPEPGTSLRVRRLVGARASAAKLGRVALDLQLPRRLRPLAQTREGLYAVARVTFHRRGRKTLKGSVQVRFHVHRAREGRR